MTLQKGTILAAVAERGRATTEVHVEEWGGVVKLRHLSVADLREAGFIDADAKPADVLVKVVAAALANEDGSRMFNVDEAAQLDAAEFSVVNRLFDEVAKLNGLSDDDVEAAVEAFVKAQHEPSSSS